MKDKKPENRQPVPPEKRTNQTRRDLLRTGGLLAAAGLGVSLPAAAASQGKKKRPKPKPKPKPKPFQTQLFPKYFPLDEFAPDVNVAGKFAVVTGASRGIGLATGEALHALGVNVIGTSRDASSAPYPTSFPLLDLDVTSDASVNNFKTNLTNHPSYPGQIDILINNGARFIVGTAVPPPIAPDPTGYFLAQTDLGMETVYRGQVRVTNRLLPHMAAGPYSRILFTVSIAGYGVGGTNEGEALGQSFFGVYYSAKRALLAYANNLRGYMASSGSPIKVSTVNPFFVNTDLMAGDRPVFTEPVDGSGNSPFNPFLQAVVDGTRAALQNGLPPSLVAQAYAQLVQLSDTPANVAATSENEPLATAGANALIEQVSLVENEQGAVTYGAAPPGHS